MEHNEQKKLFSEFPPVTTHDWEEKIKVDLKGADYEKKLIWKTDEGFPVKPYYRAEDLQGLEYLKALPGEIPFVRGNKTEKNDWIIRQDFSNSSLEEANKLAIDAIARGAGAVGLVATEITTHKQMSQLLANIDLDKTGVHFTASRSYPLTLELFIYELSHRGTGGNKILGSLNFDPISYLLLHGDFYVNWTHNLEETEYLLNAIQKRLPHFKSITLNGHYFQNAGSSLVQELAFTLASANEYIAGLTSKGHSIDVLTPHMMLSLSIGSNYFLEIAKVRAARLLWAKMVEQYHPVDSNSLKVFIQSTTARWNKTIYDPYVNLLRTTTEGMSAALGNADSVTIQPFDVSFKDADEFSSRIARNQQLILKEESYLDKIVDPAAGSYYLENLTHSIAFHAWKLFQEVEGRGGMIECIKAGFIQDQVDQSRQQKEMDVAQRKMVILGTNQYPNIQDQMLDSVKLKETKADEKESPYKKLLHYRSAEKFEEIRLGTEKYVKAGHPWPKVFLFTMGNLTMLRARAGFATNFFGCAGYHIVDNPGFQTIDEGISALRDSGAEIVVICSSDEEYAQLAPEICQKVKELKPSIRIIVAGYPKELINMLTSAGVDDFIHIRSNLLETLQKYQLLLGVR